MRNVGTLDRLIRLVLGVVLIAAPFVPPLAGTLGSLAWVPPVIGAVLVVTAILRICPAYSLLGINSCSR